VNSSTILSATETESRFRRLGLPFRFSDTEKALYKTTDVVDGHRQIFGFPAPEANQGLNILNLRNLRGTDPSNPPSFFDHPWYLGEPFARVDCTPGWHFLHMDVSSDSILAPYHYYRSLEEQGCLLPCAVEVTLMLFLCYVGEGLQLLHRKHTWCSDAASLGRFVTVGAFGRNGLFISAHPPDFTSRGLGVCAKLVRLPK
jgi:hypothetical protein